MVTANNLDECLPAVAITTLYTYFTLPILLWDNSIVFLGNWGIDEIDWPVVVRH